MSVDVQAVIQALIKANESSPLFQGRARLPVITISRDHGTGGTAIAHELAERLGVEVYDAKILDAVAKHADVNKSLMSDLHEKVNSASDAWLYAMVFGKNVTRDEYRTALVTTIRGIYRTGGVVIGRGAHLVLAGRDVLRIRLTGTLEPCAKRIAHQRNMDLAEAKAEVRDENKKRSHTVWENFHSRINDPSNFDLTVNTDNFQDYSQVVELIWGSLTALGFDKIKDKGTSRR